MSALLMGLVWGIELAPPEQTVMLALADHANDDPRRPGYGFDIYPSVELLAWKTGKSPRQIQRILRKLETMRVIVPVAYATGGRNHAVRYEMFIFNGIAKLPPEGLKGDIQGQTDDTIKGDIQGQTQNKGLKGDIQGLKGDIQGLKGDIQGLKGDIAMSPEPSYNHHKNHQRTITRARARGEVDTSLTETVSAEPEREPEAAPPPLRDAPPAFGEFAASYRKRPGKGYATPYSEIRSAYWDAYGMTPEHAAELRSEQYA